MVEDNHADVRIFQEAMRDCPFCTLIVREDGEAALEYLTDATTVLPHLILLDLNLPKKDGWEVLSEMQTQDSLRRIPVIVLTSSSAERDCRRAYELGCNAYVQKPDNYEEIQEVVRSVEQFWVLRNQFP